MRILHIQDHALMLKAVLFPALLTKTDDGLGLGHAFRAFLPAACHGMSFFHSSGRSQSTYST